MLIRFLLDRVAVVTLIAPLRRNSKWNLLAIMPMRRKSIGTKGNWRGWSLFYVADKTSFGGLPMRVVIHPKGFSRIESRQ